MENLSLDTKTMNKIDNDPQRDLDFASEIDRVLLEEWLDLFQEQNDIGIHNEDVWRDIILGSQSSGKDVLLLSIACPLWVKASDSKGVEAKFVREIPNSARLSRFSKEMSNFQKSLKTFDVSITPAITVTSIESWFLWHFGSERVPSDPNELDKMMESSTEILTSKLKDEECSILPFDHLGLFMSNENTETLSRLFDEFNDTSDKSRLEDKMFEHDVTQLPESVFHIAESKGLNPCGIVWVDMMSRGAVDRDKLNTMISEKNPTLASIAPFRNNAKWSSPVDSEFRMPTKIEFISEKIGLSDNSKGSKDNIMREILSKPDKKIEEFLGSLGIDFSIESMNQKNRAVELVEKLMFGENTFFREQMVESVNISEGQTLLEVLSSTLNQKKNHIRSLIFDGAVKINGEKIGDPMINAENNMLVKVGRKTVLKLVTE